MKVLVNGEWRLTAAETLDELVSELDYDGLTVATAADGVFVSRDGRGNTPLSEGMVVEVVAPVQGG